MGRIAGPIRTPRATTFERNGLMATTLIQVMAGLPAERRKKIEARVVARVAEELALRDLRKAMGKTQVEVARKLRISQVSLSDTERRADVMLSTLRKYVSALGGELDLIARFPDRAPVKIVRLADIAPRKESSEQRKRHAVSAKRSQRSGSTRKVSFVAA